MRGKRRWWRTNRQVRESEKKTGPEAAQRLRAMFARWAREETEQRGGYDDEPSWEEVKRALNEGRPKSGKPFPEG